MTTRRTVGYTAKPQNPIYSVGKKLITVPANVLLDVSELANNDVFILSGPLSLDARIDSIRVHKAFDLAEANDNDFGFYKMNTDGTFTAIDADILIDGVDLTASTGVIAGYDLLVANTSLDTSKNIGELLGVKSDVGYADVYLGWLMKVKEATADITVRLDIIVEESTTN